jgi:hypothetical protein
MNDRQGIEEAFVPNRGYVKQRVIVPVSGWLVLISNASAPSKMNSPVDEPYRTPGMPMRLDIPIRPQLAGLQTKGPAEGRALLRPGRDEVRLKPDTTTGD